MSQEDLANALGVTVTSVGKVDTPNRDKPVLRSNAELEKDGLFTDVDVTGQMTETIKPTYEPIVLLDLVQRNNTLNQCISAMEVNIDGTGFKILKEGSTEDTEDTTAKHIRQFFTEPYPKLSGFEFRKSIRRDLESVGYTFMEVIRNVDDEIVFINWLGSKFVRLVKLDAPVPVTKVVDRMGNKTTITVLEAERRYAMALGKKVIYLRDFETSRQLDAVTGMWDSPESPVKTKANEVIMLSMIKDVLTPYSVPRWINQIPSVIGSRKAEEFNLEFFDSGGVPPALVVMQGASLSTEERKNITDYLSGKAKYKQRGVLVEMFATGGDLNSVGKSSITIEHFGQQQKKDPMHLDYDERTSKHVRSAFRLPKLFLGDSDGYNYSTSRTSYMVAEKQVFKPERDEFDDVINIQLMPKIAPGYLYKSNPLTMNDVEAQLKALELSSGQVSKDSWIDALNEIASLTLEAGDDMITSTNESSVLQTANSVLTGQGQTPAKKEDILILNTEGGFIKSVNNDDVLIELAEDWAANITGDVVFNDSSVKAMTTFVSALSPPLRKLFNNYVAGKISSAGADPEGYAELLAHTADCGDCAQEEK